MDAFTVLADPIRRQILELLAEGEQPAGAIAAHFDVSGPAVSRHLRLLREEGFVSYRREAQRWVYELRPEPLRAANQWMDRTLGTWQARFDAMERRLDEIAEQEAKEATA